MIEFATTYFGLYLQGTLIGIGLTILAMIGSLLIGLAVALARLSGNKVARAVGSGYVALFRGIPPLLLIYIVYFGLPAWAQSADIPWLSTMVSPLDNRIISATVALAVNSGAYSAEIIRASIVSVPAEQAETAKSIGMSYWLSLRRIILPQAFRVAFAPLGNETITVLKGTSLVSVIGVTELMRTAQLTASATFQNLTAYSFAALFYVVLVILLQIVVHLVERHLRVHQLVR